MMFIRSERLFLRPAWPEDWEELHGLIADEAVVRNLARAPWPYTRSDARNFLLLPNEHKLPRFMVTRPGGDGSAIVGHAALHREGSEVQLGYWIAQAHWGQGYASEAALAVLRLGHALGHERIVAWHFVDNPASGRVLGKIGFRRTGRAGERFSLGRGRACAAVEYESVARSPDNCGDDGDCDAAMARKCAA